MPRLRHNNTEAGAILAEALLTIVILSIGLTAIIQSYLAAYRGSVLTRDYAIATLLLENKMYEIMQLPSIKAGEKEDQDFAEPFERFHYALDAQPATDNESLKGMNLVTVKLSWSAGRKQNTVETSTLLLNEEE